jgi:hypothetical protein
METWTQGDMKTQRLGDMGTWRHGDGDIRQKTEAQVISLKRLPFAHRANGSLLFVRLLFLRLLTKKQLKVIHLHTD